MEDYQVDVKKNSSGEMEEISFSGEFVLRTMPRLKEELSGLDFSTCKNFTIRLSELKSLDLAFLQMLYAVVKKHNESLLSIDVVWPEDQELTGLLVRTGFSEIFKLQ